MIRRWGMAVVTAALALIVVYGMATGARHTPDRAHALASRLRCPVCQAESVADSPSQTAQEMNQLIADQVKAGRSDKEILAFFRQRYGDWILLDPPARGRTLWVWVLPAVALVIGVIVVLGRSGRRAGPVELTAEERERVNAAVRTMVIEEEL